MPIRFPSPNDRGVLTGLIQASTGNPFRPEEESCALELLEAVLSPPPENTYQGLLATDESDLAVAYACFGATPMTAATFDLYWMVTSPACRGKGFGKALLAGVESTVRAQGGQLIRIETSSLEGEGGARRFYEREGYRTVGLIADFYRPGDDLVTLAKRWA